MNFELGNKKIAIFIIVIILLLIAGGVFWWWEIKKEPIEEWRSEYSPKEDYVVKEILERKIIKNEKMGLEAMIPEGWELDEKWEWFQDGNISLTSSGFRVQPGDLFKGCLIEIGIADYGKYETLEPKMIKDFIEMCKAAPEQLKKDGYEYLEIDGYEALKTVTTPETKKFVSIKVLVDNKVYKFGVLLYSEDKEKCSQEFDKFLETVLITK